MTPCCRNAAAAVVAAVWLHQGLWCKVLRRRSDHEAIVAAVPAIGAAHARGVTAAIGGAEVGLAVWVCSGWRPLLAAGAQTLLLTAMNGGGLLFAGERIPAPTRMLLRNGGFLVAVWSVAAGGRSR